jgi:hypothetical protein
MPAERRGPAVRQCLRQHGGRGDLTMASIRLQDLRRRLYVKAKADKDWRFWASTSMYASWRRYARPIR